MTEKPLLKQAQAGNSEAQFQLAKILLDHVLEHAKFPYFSSHCLREETRNSWLYIYQQYAEQGDTEAQFNLGSMYLSGQGVEQDHAKAAFWFNLAAQANCYRSLYHLACLYMEGMGVNQDSEEAEKLIRRASELGCSESAEWIRQKDHLNHISSICPSWLTEFDGAHFLSFYEKKAVEWLQASANQHHPDAMYLLANLYINNGIKRENYIFGSDNAEQNQKDHIHWLKKTANLGHVDAQFDLALLLKKDGEYYESISWLNAAAENGHAEAQYQLAIAYRIGSLVQEDAIKAGYWFKQACSKDSTYLTTYHSWMFDTYNSSECLVPYEEALDVYIAKAENDIRAQYDLAEMYKSGIGIERDYTKSLEWAKRAAMGGSIEAHKIIITDIDSNRDCNFPDGDEYMYDPDAQDLEKDSIFWLTSAAELGDTESQESLANKFLHGLNIEANYEQAIKWFKVAADQGSRFAKSELERLNVSSKVVKSREK